MALPFLIVTGLPTLAPPTLNCTVPEGAFGSAVEFVTVQDLDRLPSLLLRK